MNRDELLLRIQELDFTVYELILYLDTHPCDTCALESYHYYRDELERAECDYECHFGPLNPQSNLDSDWRWANSPWPWERSEC